MSCYNPDNPRKSAAVDQLEVNVDREATLVKVLSGDLDFHDRSSNYLSHNFHSFPAKFPPQLPNRFIEELTEPKDTVLDPMLGSGTTILESYRANRLGIGFDIDPLALLISRVKTTPIDALAAAQISRRIIMRARSSVAENPSTLSSALAQRWDDRTREFVDYWFASQTQLELQALTQEIESVADPAIQNFFWVALSSTIITKSGGVSLALDLGHTRPHLAKRVVTRSGEVVLGSDMDPVQKASKRVRTLSKILRSALDDFDKRVNQNLARAPRSSDHHLTPRIEFGNSQDLPLDANTVDLLVTSPPYASNAIDYMRAHKFSLVWMGHTIDDLSQKRGEYIGGESTTGFDFEPLPPHTAQIVSRVSERDPKKGRVLHRYYSEMTRSLSEAFRVIKPGKAGIFVVGNSTMRGIDTQTDTCLAEIGESVGFRVPKMGIRNLDRNRRMMPAGNNVDLDSQIQQRMHQEFVIGFFKPNAQ
jgi:DNA modification methylase